MNYVLIFTVVFLIQFTVAFEASFISPIIPYLSNHFNIKESSVIYLNMGFSLIGLMSPLFGMTADKYGKRRAIILGIISFLIGTIITGWSPSPLVFALGRTIIGIGNITVTASLMSYISDLIPYNQRGKAAGILRIAFATAILLSPIYSTKMVGYVNINYLYWSVSAITVFILLFSFKLPEDKNNVHDDCHTLNLKEVMSIMKNPISIKFLLAQFLLVISPIVMFSYLSIWLKNSFNLNQDNIGYIFTITAAGTVLGVILAASFSDKIGKMKFAKVFFAAMTILLAPLPYLRYLYLVIPLTFLYSVGLDGGWSAFQTVCSELYPKRRTVFMTLIYFVNSVCSLIFTIIGPSLFDFGGYKLMIWIGTVTSILAVIIIRHLSFNQEVQKRLGIE